MKTEVVLIRKSDGFKKTTIFPSRKRLQIFMRNNYHIYLFEFVKTK